MQHRISLTARGAAHGKSRAHSPLGPSATSMWPTDGPFNMHNREPQPVPGDTDRVSFLPISTEFAYFSANLGHIFPGYGLRGQTAVYRRLKDYASWQARLDLRDGLGKISPQAHLRELSCAGPAMYVSLHFGSYRTLPLVLLAGGRSVCVVLSGDLLAAYGEYHAGLLGTGMPGAGQGRLYLASADDPSLFFRLRGMVKAGAHIFVYADGGRGARRDPAGKGLARVQLGSAAMMVRSGYLEIAHLLDLEVHLLLDHSPGPFQPMGEGRSISCYKLPQRGSRGDSVRDGLGLLYAKFQQALLECPERWEALLYLHRHCMPRSHIGGWGPQGRLLGFTDGKRPYALDRYTYRKYPLVPPGCPEAPGGAGWF